MATQIRPVGEGIWSVDDFVPLMPGVVFPVRSVIMRLQGGALFIHSPVSFSDELAAEIARLGEVEFLFAPNIAHNRFVPRAQAQFSQARLLAPPGFQRKQPGARVDLEVDSKLPAELAADFESVFIAGAPKMNEVVLYHRATRHLLVADYFFNIQTYKGWLTAPVLKLVGAHRRPTQSKLWRKLADDRHAMRASAERVLSLDFERILLSHGEFIADGRGVAERSLSWLMEPARSETQAYPGGP